MFGTSKNIYMQKERITIFKSTQHCSYILLGMNPHKGLEIWPGLSKYTSLGWPICDQNTEFHTAKTLTVCMQPAVFTFIWKFNYSTQVIPDAPGQTQDWKTPCVIGLKYDKVDVACSTLSPPQMASLHLWETHQDGWLGTGGDDGEEAQ